MIALRVVAGSSVFDVPDDRQTEDEREAGLRRYPADLDEARRILAEHDE